jgi:hypothetical protein
MATLTAEQRNLLKETSGEPLRHDEGWDSPQLDEYNRLN